MLTKEQEEYLAELADKGIAEQKEAEQRQAEVDRIYGSVEQARLDKLAELQAQAEKLVSDGQELDVESFVDDGMHDFTVNTYPTLVAEAQANSTQAE